MDRTIGFDSRYQPPEVMNSGDLARSAVEKLEARVNRLEALLGITPPPPVLPMTSRQLADVAEVGLLRRQVAERDKRIAEIAAVVSEIHRETAQLMEENRAMRAALRSFADAAKRVDAAEKAMRGQDTPRNARDRRKIGFGLRTGHLFAADDALNLVEKGCYRLPQPKGGADG